MQGQGTGGRVKVSGTGGAVQRAARLFLIVYQIWILAIQL